MKTSGNIIIFILAFLSMDLFGQENAFNNLNSKGKKTSYWKIYLDEKALPTDSANAYFWGYEFYDNGKKTFDTYIKDNNPKNTKIIFEGLTPTKGKLKPIDGIVKWYNIKEGKNELIIENNYSAGYPQTYKQFFAGDLWTLVDFTKKYNNKDGTYFVTDYRTYLVTTEKRIKTTCWWYRQENNKWQMLKTECQ